MRSALAMMLVAVAIEGGAQDAPPATGTLCLGAAKQVPKCRKVEGERIAIPADDSERTFVWSSADGKRVAFGSAPPKSLAHADLCAGRRRDCYDRHSDPCLRSFAS